MVMNGNWGAGAHYREGKLKRELEIANRDNEILRRGMAKILRRAGASIDYVGDIRADALVHHAIAAIDQAILLRDQN